MSDIPLIPLTIDPEIRGDKVVLHLAGSIDVTGADRLADELATLVAEKPRLVVLDLTGVDFAGSAALGAIVRATIRCRSQGGDIYLVNPQRRVQQALELTRLTALFEVFASIDEATA
jgi:anti-sigma B factor antagonist